MTWPPASGKMVQSHPFDSGNAPAMNLPVIDTFDLPAATWFPPDGFHLETYKLHYVRLDDRYYALHLGSEDLHEAFREETDLKIEPLMVLQLDTEVLAREVVQVVLEHFAIFRPFATQTTGGPLRHGDNRMVFDEDILLGDADLAAPQDPWAREIVDRLVKYYNAYRAFRIMTAERAYWQTRLLRAHPRVEARIRALEDAIEAHRRQRVSEHSQHICGRDFGDQEPAAPGHSAWLWLNIGGLGAAVLAGHVAPLFLTILAAAALQALRDYACRQNRECYSTANALTSQELRNCPRYRRLNRLHNRCLKAEAEIRKRIITLYRDQGLHACAVSCVEPIPLRNANDS